MYYPFTSEFNHVQRDPWLLLPALFACACVSARVENSGEVSSPARFHARRHRVGRRSLDQASRDRPGHRGLAGIRGPHRQARDLAGSRSGSVLAPPGRAHRGRGWCRVAGRDRRLAALPGHLPELESQLHVRCVARDTGTARVYHPLLRHLESLALHRGPARALAFWEARLWSRRSAIRTHLDIAATLLASRDRAGRKRPRFLAALYLGWYAQPSVSRRGSTTSRSP